VALLLGVALLGLLTAGCGRKGPPLAPRSVAAPPVADLAVRLENRTAVLTWSVPSGPAPELPTAYRVYRARLGAETCEGCPLLFQSLGTVNPDRSQRPLGRKWTLTWQDAVEPGFRYVYKVTALKGRTPLADSNLVHVLP
jgi:predicted small lipoprotein YifL